MFTAVGGIASAACAGLFLLLPEQLGMRMLPHFVSFATGALIGAALLGLLPEAMEAVGPGGAHSIGIALVAGLGVFFIIEKLVLWRHAHSHEHEDPVTREVVAHGVTDALAHDDAPADAPVPASATQAKVAVPAGEPPWRSPGTLAGTLMCRWLKSMITATKAAMHPGTMIMATSRARATNTTMRMGTAMVPATTGPQPAIAPGHRRLGRGFRCTWARSFAWARPQWGARGAGPHWGQHS